MSKARDIADLGGVTTRLDQVGNSDGALSNRNMVLNGSMVVAQRGDQTGVTANETYFVDRFFYSGVDEGTWSLTQSTDVPSGSGFTKSAKLEITTADASMEGPDFAQLRYKVENQDIKHILKGTANAKELTLSFWVKSSLAQGFKFRLRENHSATSRQIIKAYTVATSNTWQKEVITFAGDTGGDDFSGATDTSSSFILEWMLGGSTDYQGGTASGNWEDFDSTKFDATDTFLTTVNSTFYITGVQLEVGDTATPFEHISYGDQLQKCQRYLYAINAKGHPSSTSSAYARFISFAQGANAVIWFPQYPVQMRALPSLIATNVSSSTFQMFNYNAQALVSLTGISQAEGTQTTGQVVFTTASGINAGHMVSVRWNNSPNASFQFDAEL
tara:strand:- start:72 stop:1232 length:1161 start_codon:yes stop_codon:yes gene_type:complete